ncbi:hypothetical protein SUGI_0786420 [Cryptomeria japonica]|uniref:RING-H2 finger protein ATL2 n=1 Tax=Cryptomeria japonica TaxID=3369 RepID=UPI0024149105|nr:RING-H2 finger protein ATL2 [Cryptomeria japonica]GLJ38573.1 hypothetical protein SUGI_0786420 [Cryptomeria japonica]
MAEKISINNSSTITLPAHDFPLESKEPDCYSFLLLAAMVFILSMCIITIVVCYLYIHCNNSNTLTQTRRIRRRIRVIPRARGRFSWRSAEFYFSTTGREGLGKDVIDSLPVFFYKPENFKDGLSCSVCLCEFEENDKGKILPSCNHRFHVDCVDMWLYSHSTCPLCRASVEKKECHEQVEVLTGEEVNDKEMVNSRSASGSAVRGEGVDIDGEGSVKKEEQDGVAIDID